MTGATFFIPGLPQPQGSKTAVVRNGRAVLLDGRRGPARQAFARWRQAVADAAAEQGARFDEAVLVGLAFRLPKPSSLPRRRWLSSTRPDVDKLARAVLDGLTEGGLLADDGRVAVLHASKRLVTDEATGCAVAVLPLGDLELTSFVEGWGGVDAAPYIPWEQPA